MNDVKAVIVSFKKDCRLCDRAAWRRMLRHYRRDYTTVVNYIYDNYCGTADNGINKKAIEAELRRAMENT